MLRTEGKFTIYRIEHLWKDANQFVSPPRWVSSIENEEFFPASEKCWQETGVHGTYDLEEAKEVYEKLVAGQDPNRKFRLVRVTISQTKEVLFHSESQQDDAISWISVEDRLPENNCDVLVAKKNGKVFQMSYHVLFGKGKRKFYWWGFGNWIDQDDQVAYWMPIPKSPEL